LQSKKVKVKNNTIHLNWGWFWGVLTGGFVIFVLNAVVTAEW